MSFDRVVTVVLSFAAIGIASSLVKREFFPAAPEVSQAIPRLSEVKGWEAILASESRFGPAEAPVQIVEFGDYECPFCRRFHAAFESAVAKFGDSIALTFIHYPLSMHKHARAAAIAAECAKEQSRFAEFSNELFHAQDSIGIKPWAEFAAAAGADSSALQLCTQSESAERVVVENIALGDQFGVQYTPTVMINGWVFALPPSQPELLDVIEQLLGGATLPAAGMGSAGR